MVIGKYTKLKEIHLGKCSRIIAIKIFRNFV